jgi:hypothetical protein
MTTLKTLAIAAAFAVGITSSAFAYQVTGPVVELTDSKIVVQKGKEKWELARTGATQLPVETKVGDKVTVEYTMNAEKVDVKAAAKAAAKTEKKEEKKAEKAEVKKAAPVAAAPAPVATAPAVATAPTPAATPSAAVIANPPKAIKAPAPAMAH